MGERRMLLNSTEKFVGTMRIEFYCEGSKLDLNLNDNIKIIEEYFDNDTNGYYVVGFKKDLIVPEDFIDYGYHCEIKFYSDYNIIFDTRSVYIKYPYFFGNFTFNEQSIKSVIVELYDYNYTFNDNCFNVDIGEGYIYFHGKTIPQYYENTNNYKIYAYSYILYDLMKYNNIEEDDERAQNYVIYNNTSLFISSPTNYITTVPNVNLGNNNYIKFVYNYMYNGNYITQYNCNISIIHLRTGITLPKDATVYFPGTVTDIDRDTFKNENNLKKVVIFGNCELTYLDGFNNSNLENIEIYSNKITDIKSNCFFNCTKLTEFIIPESVIKVNDDVFYGTNLKSLYIPKNVNHICNPLVGAKNIETIIVDENNSKYDSRDNCNAIIYDDTLLQGCKNTIIPNNVKYIGAFSFKSMGLKEIIIPNNIIGLHQGVFYYDPIDNIVIPESIIYIAPNCFNDTNIYNNINNWVNEILYISNCIVSVKQNISGEITILDNTRLICESAFHNLSNITKINIPNSLRYINYGAFRYIGDLIIEYDGTEEEWNSITKGAYWNTNTNITYIFKNDVE